MMRRWLLVLLLLAGGVSASDTTFTISGVDMDCALLSEYSPTTNYETDAANYLGREWVGRQQNCVLFWPTLADSMAAISATWDSARIGIVTGEYGTGSWDAGDSVLATAHLLTRAFTESECSWDSAASGTLWTTGGGDYGAAVSDTVILTDADLSVLDTIYWGLPGSSLTDSLQYGVIIVPSRIVGNDAEWRYNTDDYGTAAYRPMITLWGTLGGGAPGQIIVVTQ